MRELAEYADELVDVHEFANSGKSPAQSRNFPVAGETFAALLQKREGKHPPEKNKPIVYDQIYVVQSDPTIATEWSKAVIQRSVWRAPIRHGWKTTSIFLAVRWVVETLDRQMLMSMLPRPICM